VSPKATPCSLRRRRAFSQNALDQHQRLLTAASQSLSLTREISYKSSAISDVPSQARLARRPLSTRFGVKSRRRPVTLTGLTRSPSGTRGGQSFGRCCWRLRHEITLPTVIALSIAVGFFSVPFYRSGDARGGAEGKLAYDCARSTRTLKLPAMSTTPGTASILVLVLILQTTLFRCISHLTNCKDRKEGHPPLLVRA
jgi:hypothetical protein